VTCVAVQCIDTRTMLCSPGRWLSRRGKGPAQGCNDHASDGPTKGWVAVRSRAARATRCCSRSAAPRSPRAGTVLASWASAAATAQAAAWPPAWLGSATQACRPARLLRPRRLPTAVMPRIAWTVLRHHLLGTAVLNPQGQGSRQGRGLPRAEWACARRALGVLWLCRWMGQRFSILLLVGGTPCFWLMTASGYICQAVGHSCLCHHVTGRARVEWCTQLTGMRRACLRIQSVQVWRQLIEFRRHGSHMFTHSPGTAQYLR